MTDDGYLTLDNTSARGVVSGVTGVSWQQCVSYNATGDDLAEYGLNTPQRDRHGAAHAGRRDGLRRHRRR